MAHVSRRLFGFLTATLLMAALLAACTRSAPSKGTETNAKPPASEGSITFGVHVGALEIPPGIERQVYSLGQITLTLSFSAPMDRQSTEAAVRQGLPEGISFAWQDDRTLLVTVPPGGPLVLDAAGAISKDGSGRVSSAWRKIWRPAAQQISIYRIPDLVSGNQRPLKQWTVDVRIESLNINPNLEWAIIYNNDPTMAGDVPFLLHLASGTQKPLSGSKAGTYAFAGWLPDGRLMLAGDQVWLGTSDGEQLKPVAAMSARHVAISPNGEYVSLWGPQLGSGFALLATKGGSIQQVQGPFLQIRPHAGVQLHWSPDGSVLAGTDFTGNPPIRPQIRFVAATGGTIRVIPGFELVKWLPGGELLARPETAPETLVLLDEAGNKLRTFDINSPLISPNGQILLIEPPDLQSPNWTVITTTSGQEEHLQIPGVFAGWTMDGSLIVLAGR